MGHKHTAREIMSFDEGRYEDSQAFKCAKCGGTITFDEESDSWICDNCSWIMKKDRKYEKDITV